MGAEHSCMRVLLTGLQPGTGTNQFINHASLRRRMTSQHGQLTVLGCDVVSHSHVCQQHQLLNQPSHNTNAFITLLSLSLQFCFIDIFFHSPRVLGCITRLHSKTFNILKCKTVFFGRNINKNYTYSVQNTQLERLEQ